jgi:hypothetical protein
MITMKLNQSQDSAYVIGVLFKAQWAVNIRSMPVGLQLYGDHPMRFGQFRQYAAERRQNGG